jgi:flagellar assembly protein FliH
MVLSAHDEAREVLAKAAALKKAAENSAEAIRREAAATGYSDGLRDGREQGYAEVLVVLASARAQMISEFTRAKDAGIVIGRKLAEKILGRTFELDPSVITELAMHALVASRPRGGTVVLRTHPEDLNRLTLEREAWLARLPMVADIRVVADTTVDRGGCIVDTPVGRLDARLSTQLDALEKALRRAMGEEGGAQ